MNLPDKVPEPGFYYHYKHDPNGEINNYAYEFIGVGFHTEEARAGEEHFAIYRPLYSAYVFKASEQLHIPCFDTRPLTMWMGDVNVGGETVPRFKRIEDDNITDKLARISEEMYR